jgi:hypothetical protein
MRMHFRIPSAYAKTTMFSAWVGEVLATEHQRVHL